MEPRARAEGPLSDHPLLETAPRDEVAGADEHSAWVIEDGVRGCTELSLPREEPVTLFLNGQELVTLLASPGRRTELTVG